MSELIKEWVTEAGLNARVVRHTSLVDEEKCLQYGMNYQWFCGYVEVPESHRLYGKEYSDVCEFLELPLNQPIGARGVIPLLFAGTLGMDARRPDVVFDVHGSLTFSGGIPNVGGWWFGFDCNHVDDNPMIHDETYTAQECERLAKQLVDCC